MAIFSRRIVQQMLNENAGFLTKKQLGQHVSRLNTEGFQSIDTEWEVAVLNAFSKLGTVEHEPALEGTSELDLLFTHDDGSSFLADITSVSDEGFEEKTSVKAFYVELQQRLRKAGLLYQGWVLSVGSHPTTKFRERRKPALPLRVEFAKEIFNNNFREFLKRIKEHPEQSWTYEVSTEKTAIALMYDPKRTGFMSQMPVNNPALEKDRNPVFNALRQKAKQHKKVSYKGFRGIVLCDGGSDMVHSQPHGAFEFNYNAVDAAKDFLRQNQSIDFVLLISSVWIDKGRYGPLPGERARKVQVTIIGNINFDSLPDSLRESLEAVEQHFPEPINTASGARETIRHGHDPKALRPLAGGIGWSHNEISISASAVLALLAGRVTQEELFKALGVKPWSTKSHAMRNFFE
ncbi:MAG: hypothetical protein H0T60_05170 [Acidobacteria bacterium]|nr:hypothetical protein [Acidobacteriota bacterium]